MSIITPIKDKIKKYLSHGFYFAHNFELTLNAQKRATMDPEVAENSHSTFIGDTRGMDTRYMWNYNLCKDFKT